MHTLAHKIYHVNAMLFLKNFKNKTGNCEFWHNEAGNCEKSF